MTDTVDKNGGKRFNPIFDTFIKLDQPEESQLQGLVAYALYKRQKREWAEDLWTSEQRRPTQADLDAFVRTCTKSHLQGLSDLAEKTLTSYVSAYLDAAEPRIKAEALKGSFWRSVWPGMMAAFLYTLMLIGVLLVLKLNGVDALGLAEKIKQ